MNEKRVQPAMYQCGWSNRKEAIRAAFAGMAAALALTACQPSAERANDAYVGHVAAFNVGEMERAEALILTAIAERDDVADYWLALGRTRVERADLPGAFAAYTRAVELDRRSAEALQALAEISLLARDFDDAARYADQLLTLDSNAIGGLVVKGFVALEDGDAIAAARLADAALVASPDDAGGIILKARTLAAADDVAAAIALLERRLARGGEDSDLLAELRSQYRSIDDGPGLGRTLARLVALRPDDVDLRLDYADHLYEGGEADLATAQLTRVSRADSANAGLAERIVALWESQVAPMGAETVQQVASIFKGMAKVPIARHAITRGHDDLARNLLMPLLGSEMGSNNAEAVATYAMLLEQRGEIPAALRQAQRVLGFDAGNQTALRVRARISLSAGRSEEALRDARKLVDDRPLVAENRLLLARIHARRGQIPLASRAYREAYRIEPGNLRLFQEYVAFLTASNDGEAVRWLVQDFEGRRAGQSARRISASDPCLANQTTTACSGIG